MRPGGRPPFLPALLMAAGVVAAGCGASAPAPASAPVSSASATTVAPVTAAPVTSLPPAVTVHMDDFTFAMPEHVVAGQVIIVVNDGNIPHTFTDEGGLFDIDLKSGRSATIIAPAPGTYEVVCRFHVNSMFTTLVVEPPGDG